MSTCWCGRRLRDDLKATTPPAQACTIEAMNMPRARAVVNAHASHPAEWIEEEKIVRFAD